jgi:predicted dinucleotide-binding enzyme
VSRVALRYAIIGTGNVGTASAQAFADRVAVTIANTRGPQSLASLAGDLALAVIPATIGDARKAEVILAAVPFLQTRELSAQVAGLGGKIDGRHQQRGFFYPTR